MYVKPVLKSYSNQDLVEIIAGASTVCANIDFNCPSKSDNCPSWDDVNCPLFKGR
jgi:hypothetical protein